ncbi:MAG: fumarate hydratase [delta proteobacterium MLS_D]|jgi:fumarate hydratase subunit beta|nr:MAG: fumarate hydratase [delta proteobacterium MLS_D]
MKQPVIIHTPLYERVRRTLRAGDRVLLTGTVLTGRDVAHKRMYEAVTAGRDLPVDLDNAVLFYAAPTPAPPGRVIGSIGPTTSGRMDRYTPMLLERGLGAMIGKGSRSREVRDAMSRCGAVYFGAPGGVAALLSRTVRSARIVACEDAGPEAMMELTVVEFPLVVINDCVGGDLYETVNRDAP